MPVINTAAGVFAEKSRGNKTLRNRGEIRDSYLLIAFIGDAALVLQNNLAEYQRFMQ
jgi:hypothetical protein